MAHERWPMPAQTGKADGSPRRVGVEIELQGIPVDELARLTARTLGGDVDEVSDVEYTVQVENQGSWRVEIDYEGLKQRAKARREAGDDEASALENLAVDALSAVSSVVVPCEVVGPPLPMDDMDRPLQALTDAIRDAGGKGTGHAFYYAFGLHLNVEPPDLDATTIVAYMKAFACLFDWIVSRGEVDWARRITPYIQRYPADYEQLLTDPGYWPDQQGLIADYLESNPTRDRALDMLTLFSELDADRVEAAVQDDRIKPRPAFHYRLADCAIDDPDWSIAVPWSRWLQIERLANDRDKLNELCAAFRKRRDSLLQRVDNNWSEAVSEWLDE